MNPVSAHAFPRAGLLGNPSDLYGGRGVGFTFEDYRATVTLRVGGADGALADGALAAGALAEEAPILRAARAVLGELGVSAEQQSGFSLSCESDIPRQVGLSGSSAIVIAALRAVLAHFGRSCDADRLAELALRAETEHMGITAGPMDRVLQAHEAVLAMDFASGESERLDPGLLPPIALLIDRSPGEDSGAVHSPVRERWESGDAVLREVMAEFRPLVERGLACLRGRDVAGLMACVNRNFELRARAFSIGARDRAVVDFVRGAGGAAKFCGSGGAILAVHESEAWLREISPDVTELGYDVLRPSITGARA